MIKDIAIEEIRETRRRISEKFGNDTKKLVNHYKALEDKYKNRMVKKAFEETVTVSES